MNVLGWQILKDGDYCVDLPILSREEKELISAAEERFKQATRTKKTENKEESEKLIEEILFRTAEELGIFLSREQEDYLCRAATSHIYGFAFLEPVIQDPDIEEISVIGPGKPVYVYTRKNGWKQLNAYFETENAISDMINKLARSLGRHITLQNPRLDAALPDGSRLHASLPPVSKGEITIRKFRESPLSAKELAAGNTLSIDAIVFLSFLMQSDCSLLIAGNTASGKTTTMNALFSFVPANERIIIAEETPEINVPHEHQLRLVANREMDISLKDLVYDSLRMRPDRMIVGEVRNKEEAEALFDVLLAGQARGSYATFHAQSAKEAVSRLRSFGIPELDLESIDCIVVQRRMLLYDNKKRKNDEVRKVVEIAELGSGMKTLYKNGKLNHGSRLLDKIAGNFGLNKREMSEEIRKRRKMLLKAPVDYREFYEMIQKQLFGGV